MVLHANRLGQAPGPPAILLNSFRNPPGKREPRIDVGHKHGFRAAVDDLIGKQAAGRIRFGVRRTQYLNGRKRMGMPYKSDSVQREQPRMKQALDGRLEGFRIRADAKQQILHLRIGKDRIALDRRQQRQSPLRLGQARRPGQGFRSVLQGEVRRRPISSLFCA